MKNKRKHNMEEMITSCKCHRNGISGNCGLLCEVFLAGYCEEADELILDYLESDASQEEKEALAMSYGIITP